MKRVRNIAEAVGTILVLGFVIFVIVSAWNFHAKNMSDCDRLGGEYSAFNGTGQCVKDQVILFDPRHKLGEPDD